MSRKPTQFTELPNEVICFIFDFLTNFDILRSFTQLNRRYDNLVRFYIKRIDLTNGWQGDRQQLQFIRETIEIVTVDDYYICLLHEPEDPENMTSHPIERNCLQRSAKISLWSVMKKTFVRSKRVATKSECCSYRTIPVVDFRFHRLHSLELINVYNWTDVISGMTLKSLSLWFYGSLRHFGEGKSIPQTISRFFTNALLEPNNFHENLVELRICVRTIVQLVEILQHTPNLQCLHVTFANYFNEYFRLTSPQCELFETMTANFHRLTNLNRLSFSTKQADNLESNERWAIDQMELFMDRCCPNKRILKKVTLKLDHITFHKDIWSVIVRYKNTFDRFDFYASFLAEDNTLMNIMISSINELFDYYIEDGDRLYPKSRFVHIFSLPFAFPELRGFISCSDLGSRTSFSVVSHLHFIQTRLSRPVSFNSVARRMPYLTSIDCNLSFSCLHEVIFDDAPIGEHIFQDFYDMVVPDDIVDETTFNHVRFLRFTICCEDARYAYRNLLPQLLDRMPHLQNLITSTVDFIHTRRPLSSLKRLDLQKCSFNSFRPLVQHLPTLSTLLLGDMAPDPKRLSKQLACLFIGISSLKLICFRIGMYSNQNLELDEKIAQQAITRIKNMNYSLHHLKLDYKYEESKYYLYNL